MINGAIANNLSHSLTVPETHEAGRLDVFMAHQFPTYSRTFFKDLAREQGITVNGKKITKSSALVKAHDVIEVTFPPVPELGVGKAIEHDLGVTVVFEHPQFLIINKPAGLVCHAPMTDSQEITLVDWLLNYCKELKDVGQPDRPGIVHRLDKDTSGLMIIPRTQYAHMIFGELFQNRKVHKTYHAVVRGNTPAAGTIDFPIARHPYQKHKMTHITEFNARRWDLTGRSAATHYRLLERFSDCTYVEAKPITGRTHQIRVHFAALGHGLLGDETYGIQSPLIQRQALHAYGLTFEFEGQAYSFTQDIPEDFKSLLEFKRKDR